MQIDLLRSTRWLKGHDAQVGGTILLDMPEMGACGDAEVLAIEPCPPLEVGPGRLVTGTFRHTSGEVYDLQLASEAEPLGVTVGHPFWSCDRGTWVPAIDLRIGETLKTLTGTTVVESIIERPEPEPVYNLEVEGDHVYRVGNSGVLVHNSSAHCKIDDGPGTPGPYEALEQQYDDVEIEAGKLFHKLQKDRILAANKAKNGNRLKSDVANDPVTGELVEPPSVSPQTFPKPPKSRDEHCLLNEAQVDHIKPKADGGSNSYCNARVISMQYNLDRR